jgi:high-affinity iron transporter
MVMALRRILIVFILCCSGWMVARGQAGDSSPLTQAETIHEKLFEAQAALMQQDWVAASGAVQQAVGIFEQSFGGQLLGDRFDAAQTAAEAGDTLGLAHARGNIWAGLLQMSTDELMTALSAGDAAQAEEWLALRDFRASTRFSRPNSDAMLAIRNWASGSIPVEVARTAVQSDLLDTYQAQMVTSLGDADEAATRGFAMRRAEEIGLAQGYFGILATAYQEQRGAEALATVNGLWGKLVQAVLTNDDAAYIQTRTEISTALQGFRAAPLSVTELARRAGQFSRFIALVPVEYARGVRDGRVVHDIEIQEALTFHEGAAAAFADLESSLRAIDPQQTEQMAVNLATVLIHIQTVADPEELQATVDQITASAGSLFPAAWQTVNNDADIDVIFSLLDQIEPAVEQGEYGLAESARLEAYAMLELGIEQRLRGFAPDQAMAIESFFWQGSTDQPGLATLLGTQSSAELIRATTSELKMALTAAQQFLSSGRSAPELVVTNAGVIVFREGLEAVLIIASLLASLRTLEERKYRRPIVIGAVLAFGATALTWWFATQLLLSMMHLGERLEAVVSVIAIGMLLVIMNWFFHKVYWTGWIANFHQQKRKLIGGVAMLSAGQALGLILLGFTSIYREGFESVLFLQALVLEAGAGVVLQGVALGLAGVAVVGVAIFALQVKLPYKKMLIVTGVMIGVVLLVMVGNTVHVLQSVGWLPITPIQGVFIPFWMGQWFGLFATWQGIGLQVVTAVYVIGSYFVAERLNHSKRDQAVQRRQSTQAAEA